MYIRLMRDTVMLVFDWVRGLSVGLEYVDSEDLGFIVNLDLGLLRITWYRDLVDE